MKGSRLQVGDILQIKSMYEETAKFGIVIDINKAESFGADGWVSFDYAVLNEKEQIVHISESCVERILYSKSVCPHSPEAENTKAGKNRPSDE